MKKGLYIAVALLSTCLLSGCETKTLKCTRENNYNDEMKMNQDLKIQFKDNKMSKVNLSTKITLNDNYKEYQETFKQDFEKEIEQIKNAEGFKYSSKDNSDGFTFSIEADITKDKVTKESSRIQD